jgi:hypothetical protein
LRIKRYHLFIIGLLIHLTGAFADEPSLIRRDTPLWEWYQVSPFLRDETKIDMLFAVLRSVGHFRSAPGEVSEEAIEAEADMRVQQWLYLHKPAPYALENQIHEVGGSADSEEISRMLQFMPAKRFLDELSDAAIRALFKRASFATIQAILQIEFRRWRWTDLAQQAMWMKAVNTITPASVEPLGVRLRRTFFQKRAALSHLRDISRGLGALSITLPNHYIERARRLHLCTRLVEMYGLQAVNEEIAESESWGWVDSGDDDY